MKFLFCILFVLAHLLNFAQNSLKSCNSILTQEPYFIRYNNFVPDDSLLKDITILKNCSQLDSIDIEILQGDFIRELSATYAYSKKHCSFKTVLKKFDRFKKTPDYSSLRTIYSHKAILQNTLATKEHWDKYAFYFRELGVEEPSLILLKDFFLKNSTTSLTYWQWYQKLFTQ